MNVKITIPCPFCNGETTFIIPTEEYNAYKKSGDTKVFTALDDNQIETLSTGTCCKCIEKSESDGCECSDDECCFGFDDHEYSELEESAGNDEYKDATIDVSDPKEIRICDIIMRVWCKLTGKPEFTGEPSDWDMLGVATVEAQKGGLLTEGIDSERAYKIFYGFAKPENDAERKYVNFLKNTLEDAPTVDVEDGFCERVGNEIKGAWQRISKHFKWNGSETDKVALDDAITNVSLNLKNSKNTNNWEDNDEDAPTIDVGDEDDMK